MPLNFKFFIRPKFIIGLVLWAVLLCLPLKLAEWQFERLIWKEKILQSIAQQSAQSPKDNPITSELLSTDKPLRLIYQRGTLEEAALAAAPIFIGPRPKNDVQGFHVYAPVILGAEKTLITHLGWVAAKQKENLNQALTKQIGQTIVLEGFFMPQSKPSQFSAKNFPEKNIWLAPNRDDFLTHYQLDKVTTPPLLFYASAMTQESSALSALSHNRYSDLSLPNNHQQYAWFWSGLALLWVIIPLIAVCGSYRKYVREEA